MGELISSQLLPMAWRGVTCGARGQRRDRVTALELPRLNLSGTISPKIANLTFLTRLDLSKNQLHGTVPYELSLLLNLNHLGLSFNTLGGNILPSLSRCSSLRNISLGFNNLQGKKFACQSGPFYFMFLLCMDIRETVRLLCLVKHSIFFNKLQHKKIASQTDSLKVQYAWISHIFLVNSVNKFRCCLQVFLDQMFFF